LGWLVQRAVTYAPGELSVRAAHGRLHGPIRLEGIVYRTSDAELKLERIELDWAPWLLLKNEFHITRLALTQLDYVVLQPSPTPTAIKLPNVVLPVGVVVEQLQIEALRFRGNPTQAPLVIDSVMLQADVSGSVVEIAHLEVESALFSVQSSGRIQTWGDYPLNLATRWSIRPPQRALIQGEGEIRGDLLRINSQQTLSAPVKISLEASIIDVLKTPRWELNASASALDVSHIDARWKFAPLDVELAAQGDHASINVSGKLRSTHPATGEFALIWQGRLIDAHVAVDRVEAQLLNTDTRVRLSGSVELDARAEYGVANINASGNWQALRWPLRGAPTVLSPEGDFSFTGAPENYTFAISAPLRSERLPNSELSVQGHGNMHELDINSINIAVLDGAAHGGAVVKWDAGVIWNTHLSGAGLNPGALWSEWPGQLAFELGSAGEAKDGHLRANVNVAKLAGRLRGYPLDGHAQLTVNDDDYELRGAELRSDTNSARVRGALNKDWQLDWDISAPKLVALLPQLQGALNARGQVRGPRETPQVRYTLKGESLRFDSAQAARVDSQGELDFNEQRPTKITLQAQQLLLAGAPVDSMVFGLDGSLQAHRLTAALRAPDGEVDVSIDGQWRDSLWSGQIARADLRQVRYGAWMLEQAAVLQGSSSAAHLAESCWRSEAGRLCADVNWSKDSGVDLKLSLAELPLTALRAAFPEGIGATGVLSGALRVHAQPRDKLATIVNGTLQLQLGAGQISLAAVTDEVLNFEHRGADVKLVVDAQGARLDAKTDFAELGTASVNLQLPNWQPEKSSNEQTIAGRVQADIKELGFLTRWIPAIDQVRGVVHADAKLHGSLAQPRYEGVVSLRDGAAALPQQGIHLKDVNIEARSRSDEHIEFHASAHSGPGQVEIQGNVALDQSAGWPLTVEIKGKDFEAVNLPEAWVLASPEMQIYKARNRIDLNGVLQIPQARYTARDVSASKTPSSDVVLVGKEEKPRSDDKWQIYSTVRFSFGDKVSFNGFGLKGLVRGEVVSIDEPKKLTTGYGELQIVDATFNAYKIDLRVTRGRLVFAGGPINNPGIDARAIRAESASRPTNSTSEPAELREPGAIVAGVLVRGTVRNLELTLFSEPARDQAEVLSLLLFGVPLGDATSEQGKALFLAASSLRLSGRDETVRKIGKKFGIEEIRLEAGSTPDQASLVIGRYLGPRLYINYSVGLLANTTNVLRVRYRLSNKWLLQSEQSDAESAADLLYTFEH
jgi:translocation and assembly module TamB